MVQKYAQLMNGFLITDTLKPLNGFSKTDSANMVTLYSDKALNRYSGKAVKHHSVTVTALHSDKVLKHHSGKVAPYYNINAPPG